MEVRRIGPETGLVRELKDLRKRIQTQETRPAGKQVIRETLTTVDPDTGVKTIFGELPDGSFGIQPFVYDITPPPVATTPIVSAKPGVISVSWDGLFANNGELPRDFECVNIIGHKMNGTTTVSSKPVGTIRRPLDFTYLQQDVIPVGETWQFSLEAEDYNGNLAQWSARSASVTMESVVSDAGVNAALEALQDATDTAQQAADTAQGAANTAQQAADDAAQAASDAAGIAASKSKVLIQSTAPAAADQNANVLWIDTTNGGNTPKRWSNNAWVVVTDKVATDAAAAAAAAQSKADTAFNNAASAAQAAGNAQTTADGKNSSYYLPSAPAGTGFKVGDQWFDTANNYRLKVWSGSAWVTAQDAFLAQQTADSKSLVYTQATVPPVSARLATTVWYDTSLGLDKVVQKYWDSASSSWKPLADKTATDAAAVADSKGETIYSDTEPAAAKRLPQNTWVDTTGGINIVKRWDGNAWVVAADSRIASTATAVTAAQKSADDAAASAAAKSVVYTQSVTPPVSARLPQTVWNDTSLGLNNVVVKYWDGNAWTAMADKVATDAAAVAAAKTKTYFQPNQPSNTGNTTGDLWFDTDDLNKPYVWNGSAWTLAQDATVNKSLFSTFATDIDNTKPNKWMFTRYNKTMPSNTTVPTYLDIAGLAGTSTLVDDGTNLVNTVGDNYVGQLRTIVYLSAGKTIAVTATHDDAAQILVDGTTVYSKGAYTQNSPISFTMSAGWHVLDLLWTEITGGDGWFAISPTFSSQVTNMYAPVALSSLSAAVTAAQSSADTAMAAQSYSLNASFDDWTATYPTGYNFWSGTAVKETSIVRRAPYALRFNVADATAQHGVSFSSILSHAPNLEYFTVEIDLYLVSGTLDGSGMILDWSGAGASNNRTQINFVSAITSPVTGKWYRVQQVLRRPANFTGTWTNMSGYLMGQWSGHGTGAAKNIIFDWFNIRPSSVEEILAFGAPADAQAKATAAQTAAISAAATDATSKANQAKADAIASAASDATVKSDNAKISAISVAATAAQAKADAAQAAAISAAATDATNKANTAQQAAIDASQVKIDQVWAAARSYINPATSTTGIVAKQGPIPSVVTSVSAMGGKALQKSGGVSGWWEDTNGKQAYDPTAVYRFSTRIRVTSPSVSTAGGGFYWGLVGLADDKTTYVNTSGANSYSSQQWVTQNAKPATTGDWVDYVVYYKGVSTGNPTGAGTVLDPRTVQANTKYFMPGMILDYANGTGTWEISHWSVDVIDQAGYQALVDAAKAKTDAIAAAAADATTKANAAQQAAITAAATDAANKASAAQQAAIDAAAADAAAKAAQAQQAAIDAAALDAQAKADAAEQAAIDAAAIEAQLKADGAEQAAIDAAATDAAAKAAAAQQAAIDAAALDATAKATQAKTDAITAAATDAQTRATQAKADAISAAALDATAKADAAQMAAIQAQAYQLNPSFEDWTGTIPASYTTFVTNPTKETTTVRTGKYAVRFNCTDTTTQRGLQFNAALAHAPYFEYLTVELDVRLDSGSSFGGAGVLVDWGGMTGGNRATISLATEIPAPVVGRWYRMVKVIRKPATATGTFTSYSAWLMGQYGTGMGTQAVKNVIFDWINVRPATTEEITAYGTPASIQSLSDVVSTKTKSWYQPGQPPLTGNTTGDLWFDTDDNNKVYIWNGTWAVASDQRIESLNTSVSSIQTTANGKNKVIYSTSAASGTTGYVAGDTWFQRDASNNIIGQWEFTTSWQVRKLDDAMVANLNAAKIIAGTLDAQRIGANSLSAGKLMVSDMEELIPNPFFHPNGEPVQAAAGTVVSTASSEVSAGAPYPYAIKISARDNHPFATPNIAVRPGDQFYMEAWVCAAPTTTRQFNFYIFGSSVPVGSLSAKFASGQAVTGTWVKKTYSFTVPLNATYTYIKPVLQVETIGGDTSDKWVWYVTGWSMRRKNTGELIVDGAIKAGSAIIDNLAVSNAQIADLAISTAKIQNLAVKTAQIDDLAVTDGKITSLNAGKITAGYLDSKVIAAGSIKADKLDVTLGGLNLVANSSFEVDSNNDGLADNWNTWARGAGDASRTFANTRPAGLFPGSTYAQRVTSNNVSNTESSSIQSSTLFSIAPGASATLSLYARASVAGNYPVSIRCEDDTGAYKGDAQFIAAVTTTVQRFSGTVITPAGTTRAKVTITTPTSLTSGHWFEVDGIKCELGDVVSAWSPLAVELLPGTIVGTFLRGDAIDGMIITGSTFQTTATANRGIKFTSTELAGYDNSGNKNFSLLSSGSLSLKGDLTSGSTITGATVTGSTVQTEATASRGIKLTTTELAGYDTSGNKNFSLTTGGTLTIKGDITAGSTITGATITGATVQTEVTAARGIKLTSTEFAGYDTAGAKNFSLTSAGVLSLKGSIESGSTIKGATLAAGAGGIETSSSVNRGVKLKDTGIVAYDSNGNMTFKVDAATGLVEAPGIKANSITGDMIAANTITVQDLLVGDFTNLVDDADLNGAGWYDRSGVGTASNIVVTSGLPGPSWKLDGVGTEVSVATKSYFSVVPGSEYRISIKAQNQLLPSGTPALFRIYWFTETGAAASAAYSELSIPTGSWNTYAGNATPPADARRGVPTLIHGSSATGGSWWAGLPAIRRKNGGDLIVDGAIDGTVISGATIQTEKTANRGIKLTTTELSGYDTSGNKNFSLTTAGALTVLGTIKSGSTIEGATITGTTGIQTSTVANRGAKITNTGIITYDSSGNMTFKVDGTTGLVEAPGLKANSITGDMIATATLTAKNLLVGDYANIATINENIPVTISSYGQTMVSAGYNKLVNDAGNYLMFTDQRGPVPFSINDTLYFEFEAKATAATTAQLGVWTYDGTGNASTLGTTVNIGSASATVTGEVKVVNYRPNATQFVVGLNGVNNKGIQVRNVKVYKKSGGNLIVDGSLKSNHFVSDTIDGGIIKAGSLSATKIESKSIKADQLVISSTDNLIVESAFEHPTNPGASWERDANKIIQVGGGRNGGNALRFTGTVSTLTSYNVNNKVMVDDDNRFRVSMWVKTNAAFGNGAIRLGVKPYKGTAAQSAVILFSNSTNSASANYVPGTDVWTQISGFTSALPSGTTAVEFYLSSVAPSTTAYLDVASVAVTRAADGNLVVDGAIDGKTITGATIQTASPALSGARLVMDGTGLRGWDASNKQYLSASSTGLAVTGSLGATGDGVDYAIYDSTTGQFGSRPVYVGIGGAAGAVGLGTGGQTWPYPSPYKTGTPIPGIIFKPTTVDMYDVASMTARDGVTVSLQSGVTQADFDAWAAQTDGSGTLVNARKTYMPTIMTLNQNGVNFSKYVEAPEYRIGGTSLSTASVVTYTGGGSVNNQTLTTLASYTRRDDASTDTFLFTVDANGYEFVARDTGVYEIFVNFAIGGPATGRSFVEVVNSSDSWGGARAFFGSGEDTQSLVQGGFKMTAGQKFSIRAFTTLGSGSINTGYTVRITKMAAPLPVKQWGEGDITQTGNVTVQGELLVKPKFAQFYNNGFNVASGSASWDSGPVTMDTAKCKNNDFTVAGPYAGSVSFTQTGWYSISLFIIPTGGNPFDSWARLFLGSTGENLVQDGNRPQSEIYLSTIPIYITAGDYVRSTVVSPGGFTCNSVWKIAKMPWSNA